MQSLQINNHPSLARKEVKEIEDYVGIAHKLPAGFSLFVSFDDLNDPNVEYVHFLAYSIGSERITLWGVYDRTNNKILFDSACQFNKNITTIYSQYWKNNNIYPVSATSANRIEKRLVGYGAYASKHPLIKTREDYKFFIAFKAWRDNKIDDETFYALFEKLNHLELSYFYENEEKYKDLDSLVIDIAILIRNERNLPEIKIDDEYAWWFLDEAYQDIATNIEKYESLLNINVLVDVYLDKVNNTAELKRINLMFRKALERSNYSKVGFTKVLNECPTDLNECDYADPSDEKNPCAVFRYGHETFYAEDVRHPNSLK